MNIVKPKASNSGKIHILVGIISRDSSTLSRLLKSSKVIRSKTIQLEFFVFANNPDFKKPSVKLKNSTIKYVPLKSDSFLDIAEARNFLQDNIYQYCNKKNISPIVWLLDEDLIIDERANNYLPTLPKFKTKGVDVVVGSIEGDSPNSAFAGMQIQLFDLIKNLKWLNALDENSITPNREQSNQKLRSKYPDYYYDFSSKHNGHLHSNFWITPSFTGETVNQTKARIYSNLDNILSGRNIFRPIIQEKIDTPKDTLLRGGITFILNLATLKVKHPIININNVVVRRSDMLWTLINKEFCYKKIVKTDFSVIHHRQQLQKEELSSYKTIKEIYGSTVFNALKIYYENQQSVNFEDVLHDQVSVRVNAIKDSVKKTNAYIAELEEMKDLKISDFCQSLKVFYCLENTDFIIQKTQQLANYSSNILSQFESQQPIIKNYCDLENSHGVFKQYDLGDDNIKLFSKKLIEDMDVNQPPLVRIHAACCNSEVFGAIDCDCASQLNQSFKIINDAGNGLIIYLNQEGRGHGYSKKIAIVNKMQTNEIDTYQASQVLGFKKDIRTYECAANLLKGLGFVNIRLLSNNPDKENSLSQYGIKVISERIKSECTPENIDYLISKQEKASHQNLVLTEKHLHEITKTLVQKGKAIYFRNKSMDCFEFSNFSDYPFILDGKHWRTVEHYYQAQKFYKHPEIYNKIQSANTADLAKTIADTYISKINTDWTKHRVAFMHNAVQAKFDQNQQLKAILLETEDKLIVERIDTDSFWGDGKDGKGKNMLGKLLMHLRESFKNDKSQEMEGIELSDSDIQGFLQMIKAEKSNDLLVFLNNIISGMMTHIPFQNLTLINTKCRPSLDLIVSDMLNGIGGLCNVRNTFLYILLNNLNFNVQFLSATMQKPDCHIVLLVTIKNQKYLVDIGNGFPYMQAMNISDERVHSHPYIEHKIIEKDGRFHMCHRNSKDWLVNYHFDLNPVLFSSFDNMLDKQYSQKDWGPFLTGIRINKWHIDGGMILRDKLLINLKSNTKKEKKILKTFTDFEQLVCKEQLDNNFSQKVDIQKAWVGVNK
ncbi:3,4-dihydroxy-2-butanone 4-phosphate synthase / GTP cyclohydrolase II [uncultured Candidatus Thioglobus sp.]|nr:3,4-dihydroxy-2-butanone 4-phosphate synthase / GTP cyclohydrolase II [uncultured Candidatus Thioglobus sp.]